MAKYAIYEEISKVPKIYKKIRDFTSSLKNFDLIKTIDKNATRRVNAVPIISIKDSDVTV